MKEIKPKFTDKLEENQMPQEIDNNNPEPVIEITTPTPITIEDMIEPMPELNDDNVADTSPTPEPVIIAKDTPKNTVRYINSGFTF